MTDLACLIGWPVENSLSPAIHNAGFEACGLDWTYVTLAVRPGAIEDAVGLLDALSAGGANVTIPHKRSIVPYLVALEGDAAAWGAVNTLVRREDGFVGHNTDGEGFLRFLRSDAAFDPAGARALVLGAGGAARAVASALARAGAAVTLTARRQEQADEAASLDTAIGTVPWASPVAADLVVNATPLRDGLPADAVLGDARLVVDLIYVPPDTGLVSGARVRGIPVFDGVGMLVHQAALSFELWTGVPAPIDVMRAAAESARRAQNGGVPPAQAG